MRTRYRLLFSIVILILISLACGTTSDLVVSTANENKTDVVVSATNDNRTDVNNNQPTQAEPTPQLGSTRSNPAPVGSEIIADNMAFVILGSTRPATEIVMAGNMFNTEPEEGQEYLFVELQVTCQKSQDEQCSISASFNIKLVGSSGIERDAEWFVSGVDGLFEDNQFYGGATIKGQIPFIINQDETNLVLVYEPLFGDTFYLAVP